MIPKIIHYCWFGGGDIPATFQNYIAEWKVIHPNWEIVKWDESNFEFDNDYLLKASKTGNWSNISNYVRLKVLYDHGGVYLDTDFKIIRPFDSLLDLKCFVGMESDPDKEGDFSINNAVIGALPKYQLIQDCLNQIPIQFDGNEQANLSGPVLLTKFLKDKYGFDAHNYHLDDIKVFEKDVFYPLPFDMAHDIENLAKYVTQNTFAVHTWGRSWYSKHELLDRIDSQTRFIEEHLNYIKQLEHLINSEENNRKSGVVYSINYREVEKISRAMDDISANQKKQEYFLYNINKRLSNMEESNKQDTEKQHTLIYDFLLRRLSEVEDKVTDLKIDQKVSDNSVEHKLATLDRQTKSLDNKINQSVEVQTALQKAIGTPELQYNNVLKEVTSLVKELQVEFKKEVSDLLKVMLLEASPKRSDMTELLSEAVIDENHTVYADNVEIKKEEHAAETNTNYASLTSEIASLKLLNESLLKENQELNEVILNHQTIIDSKSEEVSRLTFKFNSLTSYIDNFGHVRNEYEQRIMLLEDLIQKMRLKNRAKRLVGVYKPNN